MNTNIPFLKLFNSSNSYFDNPIDYLTLNRQKVKIYLQGIKNYTEGQTKIYLAAYDYFVANPLEFDGATATEDLYDIDNLELASMLHDYLYIKYNCAGSIRYRLLSDKLFRKEMQRMNKSSWNRGYRFLALLSILFIHTPYSWLIKARRMSTGEKINVDGLLTVLNYQTPKKWHQEFRGEIIWLVIFIVSLIFIIN